MKKAFTMIELVFVLVVIGILAATIIPRTRTNPVQEAAINLVSQIRYTQHLAMSDDKYGSSATWYRDRWQMSFVGNTYSIQHNDGNDYAKDPLNPANEINAIELKGLDAFTFTVGNTADASNPFIISFDYLGRPMVGSLAASNTAYVAAGNAGELLSDTCKIKLTNGSETEYIDIERETGYARIRD